MSSGARTRILVWSLHVFFLLALSALLAFAWLMYQSVVRGEHAESRVEVAERVIGHLEDLRELFIAMESAQRGLLLTDNSVYLTDREDSTAQLHRILAELKQASHGGPRQAAVQKLEELVSQRLRIAIENYDLRRQLGFQQPWPASATESAIQAGRRFRDHTEQMRHLELAILASSEAQATGHEQSLRRASMALVVIALLLAVPLYTVAVRELTRRLGAERRIHEVLGYLPLVVWQMWTTPGGRRTLIYVAPNAHLWGIHPLEPKGSSDADVVLFDKIVHRDRPRVEAAMAACEKSLNPFDEQFQIIADDKVCWIHCRAVLLRHLDKSIIWNGYWADITGQRQIQEQLEFANQELEAFAYSVSHDLRAPLSTIDGFSKALVSRLRDLDSHSRHYVDRICNAVSQMSNLIDALLDLSVVSRKPLNYSELNLSAMADEVVAQLREQFRHLNVEVYIESGMRALGDPVLVRQVLHNLMSNAWKFSSMSSPPTVRFIAGSRLPGRALFLVQDNGPGFDMALAERLFVPFHRLHRSADFPGTGIGLALVRRVITRHGGDIFVEAEVGCGATFCFSLPVPAAASVATGAGESSAEPTDGASAA